LSALVAGPGACLMASPPQRPGQPVGVIVSGGATRAATGELAFYRCFTPRPTPLAVLVKVAGRRWTIDRPSVAALPRHRS
jgi:hypothetical protein